MKILKGYQPICLFSDKLLLYKSKTFIIYDILNTSFKPVDQLDSNIFNKIICNFRLLSRLLRTEIKSSLQISTYEILFTNEKSLYYINIEKNEIKKLCNMRKGFSNPLNICRPIKCTKYIALYGDYGNNPNFEEVSVYGICNDLTVNKIYTFNKKKIRHIHNIICDEIKEGYYIFTGDNEEDAGIYWADKDFNYIYPILVNSINGRAVCGFVTKKGLLYATDNVDRQNYICLLKEEEKKIKLKILSKINGSCIYSTKYKNGYIFSTTVESNEDKRNRILNLLSIKRGKGIITDDVELIQVSEQLEIKVMAKFKKDCLPYKLFQYGSIRFPNGLENSKILVIYPFAVKKYDGDTILFLNEQLNNKIGE